MKQFQPLAKHQGVGQLAHELQGVERIDRLVAPGQLFQPLRQRQAVDMSLGDVGAAVGCLADVVDGGDIGVANLGHGARAVDKTAGKAAVFRQTGTHNIQPHQTIVIDVVGLIQVRIPLLGEALLYLILIQQVFEQARYSHLSFGNALDDCLGSNDVDHAAERSAARVPQWLALLF